MENQQKIDLKYTKQLNKIIKYIDGLKNTSILCREAILESIIKKITENKNQIEFEVKQIRSRSEIKYYNTSDFSREHFNITVDKDDTEKGYRLNGVVKKGDFLKVRGIPEYVLVEDIFGDYCFINHNVKLSVGDKLKIVKDKELEHAMDEQKLNEFFKEK